MRSDNNSSSDAGAGAAGDAGGDEMSCNLFLSNMPVDVNEETVGRLFGKFGTLTSVKVLLLLLFAVCCLLFAAAAAVVRCSLFVVRCSYSSTHVYHMFPWLSDYVAAHRRGAATRPAQRVR